MLKYLVVVLSLVISISCNSNNNKVNNKVKKDTSTTLKAKKETSTLKVKKVKEKIKKYENKDALKVEIKYPKTAKNGILIYPEVVLNNVGEYPIVLLSMNIQVPRTSENYSGTIALKAVKHKFKKGKSFTREYTEVSDSKHYMYTVPEVHKIKDVVYPGTQKKIKLKLVPQLLTKEIYKARVSIAYVVIDDSWNNKVYLNVGINKKDGLIREMYTPGKTPEKLEGNLLPSAELGKAINKKKDISMKLTGWLPKIKNINSASEYAYMKSLDSWIYSGGMDTFIQNKAGKIIIFKGVDAARTIMKAHLEDELKVYLHKNLYKDTQKVLSPYIKGKIKDQSDFYNVVIPSEKVPELLLKLKKINYSINKGHSVLKLSEKK